MLGKILNVVKHMCSNIKYCIMLNQEATETFVCNNGAQKGENMSSLLFVFCVNDFQKRLTELNCGYIFFKVQC